MTPLGVRSNFFPLNVRGGKTKLEELFVLKVYPSALSYSVSVDFTQRRYDGLPKYFCDIKNIGTKISE